MKMKINKLKLAPIEVYNKQVSILNVIATVFHEFKKLSKDVEVI